MAIAATEITGTWVGEKISTQFITNTRMCKTVLFRMMHPLL